MREHRVPMLGDAWRRHPDPERSADPRVQAVLRGLTALHDTAAIPGPEPVFRADLRAQLVAITPRIIAESAEDGAVLTRPRSSVRAAVTAVTPVATSTAAPKRAAGGSSRPSAPRHTDTRRPAFGGVVALPFARIATITACALVAMALVLGGGVFLSRDSVPGDTLYGLKRANERFQLATDSSDTERASDLLRFASTRADEARTLAGRAQATAAGRGALAAGLSSNTQSQIRDTLASADEDVRHASRLLAGTAVDDASDSPLQKMTSWAPTQLTKLTELSSTLRGTPLETHVARSASLVAAADTRAKALSSKVGCACLQDTTSDSLGPKPCSTCPPASSRPGRNGGTGGNPAPTTAAPQPRTGTGVTPNPARVTPQPPLSTTAAGHGKPSSTSTTKTPKPPGVSLPALPTKLPISVTTCGVDVSIIGLNINLCKTP